MKTLVNKTNPEIRITAPEITTAHPPVSNEGYVYWIPAINQMYSPIDWTLVVEEPEKINFYQRVHQSYEDKVKMYMTTTKEELAEMMARRDCIEDALQQQRMFDISQEPVTRMVGEQGALEIEKVNCPPEKHPDKFTDFEWLVGNLMFRGCDLDGMTDGEDDNGTVTKLIKDRAVEMMELLERELDPNAEPADLEKEIDKTVSECTSGYNFDWDRFARHFYELGLNAKK